MAKSYQKHNLAKARSSRHNKSEELETDSGESDSDCGYEGGVDCDPSVESYTVSVALMDTVESAHV